MTRKAIMVENLGTAGPYSHAVDADGLFFLSGQTPKDPATGKLVPGDIAEQTRQSFANLFAVLAAAGLTPDDVQKVNVFLTSMDDFAAMNEVYKQQFTTPFPARSTIGVASLPEGAKVEIEIIARKK